MYKKWYVIFTVLFCLAGTLFWFNGYNPDPLSAPGQILVKFTDKGNKEVLESRFGLQEKKYLKFIDTYVYKVNSDRKEAVLESLAKRQDIAFAEPDYIVKTAAIPNDPGFVNQWGSHNAATDVDIDAPEAWDTGIGSGSVVVAVIDTGVDYNHEDLAVNMWINSGETAGDEIDNDGNGYIDDIHGVDTGWEMFDTMDISEHGTHNAGIIGAVGNNGIGVTGVSWNVKIMVIRCIDAYGGGLVSTIAEGIQYAVDNGAHIINNSWGGSGTQTLYEAIAAARDADILFVCAAGNDGMDNDNEAYYPASYNLNNVLSVAATDSDDNLAASSNYGDETVDVAAPGVNIYSTIPGNLYDYKSGTSPATAYVSGLAALLKARNPALTYSQLKALILYNADPLASLSGKVATGARINANASIQDAFSPPPMQYNLKVASYPGGANAAVTVSPADINGSGDGNTTFTRQYIENTVVQLTAPAVHNGMNFWRWDIVDVGSQYNQTIQLTMTTDFEAVAVYSDSGVCAALDNCDLTFLAGGDNDGWFGQSLDFLSDNDALQTPVFSRVNTSYLETTLTGPVFFSYYEKITNGGHMTFFTPGVQYQTGDTLGEWRKRLHIIPAGTHTVKWQFHHEHTDVTSAYALIDKVQCKPFSASGTIVDFDQDGRMDILWRNYSTGKNLVWFMDGATKSRTFDLPTTANTSWRIAGTGDFNADGHIDILWRNYSNGNNTVWLMNGVVQLSTVSLDPVASTTWRIGGTGDFNADGHVDILWRNYSTGNNTVWLMNGTTRTSIVSLPAVASASWRIGGGGDFNGDGKDDILWRNYSTGNNTVWMMDGTTRLSIVPLDAVVNTSMRIAGTGDFDDDGKVDIIWRNYSTGNNTVWLMDGTIRLSVLNLDPVPNTDWRIVISGD